MTTLFEKIINREIPAEIIFEDDRIISFLDINPINKGHALVVPKAKFINIFDADSQTLCHMIQVAQKLAIAIKETTGATGVNILMNNGTDAEQEILHFHVHIIPRFKRGEAFIPAKHEKYEKYEISTFAEKIKNAITK